MTAHSFLKFFLFSILVLSPVSLFGAENPPAQASSTVSSDPKAVKAFLDQGMLLLKAGLPEKALSEFKKARKADSNSSVSAEALARAYLALTKWGKAKRFAEKAIQLDPSNADAYADLIFVHQKKGDWMPGLQ